VQEEGGGVAQRRSAQAQRGRLGIASYRAPGTETQQAWFPCISVNRRGCFARCSLGRRQALFHIEGEGSIGIDVLPLQRRQRPEVGGGKPSSPFPLLQNLLDHEGAPCSRGGSAAQRRSAPDPHHPRQADRYVPILPALADELRTHLQGRQKGFLFESNRHTRYSSRMVQSNSEGLSPTGRHRKASLPPSAAAFRRHDPAGLRTSSHRLVSRCP
jgi:hypothetical protein